MADAPDLVAFLKHRTALHPGSRIQNIAAVVREQAQAIIDSPASTGGINDEELSIAPQNLRPFANRHTEPFLSLVRCGDEHACAADRQRVAHRCEIKILLAVPPPRP